MTTVTKNNGKRRLELDEPRLVAFIQSATQRYPHLDAKTYTERVLRSIKGKEEISALQITNTLRLAALDNVGFDDGVPINAGKHPDWTYVASYIYLRELYKQASVNRVYDSFKKYGDFYSLICTLTNMGIYSMQLLETYSKKEIQELGECIVPERDKLFTYIGIVTLADRYLGRGYNKETYELPQERWMVIAMHLMKNEPKEKRLELVKQAYWALSNLYMTVATPTMANSGKSYGQLSSCFIDTVEDDLLSIYNSNTDVSQLSKGGGGIGVYLGKIRSRNSQIRNFKNVSSGVIPWMRQLNNTAVSVDQLGNRPGSIVVWLDVHHKDIFSFLDARLNNGDERHRTHDIFTGVCVPDIFKEKVKNREDWYIFDPHTIREVMGFSLEDYYDEEKGKGSYREKYQQCVEAALLGSFGEKGILWDVFPAIEIEKAIMVSQLETGTPYEFFRDEVNRKNPNKHKGMIYSSNLCVEIAQNMSATTVESTTLEDGKIVITKTPGDFVVCNLSSINLAKAVTDDVLEALINIQVRMLDNVIDLNTIDVLQAQVTNKNYRAVGLGTFGWHHLLALKHIGWNSDKAVEYADELYEKIAYLTIKASADLAIEKGAYPYFEGSEWHTGKYFIDREYIDKDLKNTDIARMDWEGLYSRVARTGIRNGYLLAVAPNGSSAFIGGSTQSIDPIYKKVYSEEKKNFKIPVAVPGLSAETYWYYTSAFNLNQKASIRQNAARQRHIDQSQSFNLYVKNDIKAKELLDIRMYAWEMGLKTTYYVRSTSLSTEACESCI